MIYLLLFWEFFKTGLLAFGGGLATVPFLQRMVDTHGWMSQAELMHSITAGESIPGPIGVNAATYVGFHVGGVWGATVATFALVLPSVIVMIFVARALSRFRDAPLVQKLFSVLRPVSLGLIAATAFAMLMETVFPASSFNPWNLGVLAVLIACLQIPKVKKWDPILFILGGGLLGLLVPFV
ncbi:MAG: chromate transporter [Clostridiales bacterium]|nr:chromate transporter [Clostridiales bacterium]